MKISKVTDYAALSNVSHQGISSNRKTFVKIRLHSYGHFRRMQDECGQ